MSPNSSIHLVARSPGSAEPEAATTFSDEVSYLRRVSSGSSRMRCIITGTTTSDSALVARDLGQALLGVELAPQHVGRAEQQPEREVGEAPGVEQRRRDVGGLAGVQGIFESSDTAGSSESGLPRPAPLGVPVVPEVRIVTRPSRSGGTGLDESPSSISSSRLGSSVCSESCQATKRLRRLPASSSSSANSSS